MSYRLAADALVWLHLGFILFVLFGGLLPLRGHAWPGCTCRRWPGAAPLSSSACPVR